MTCPSVSMANDSTWCSRSNLSSTNFMLSHSSYHPLSGSSSYGSSPNSNVGGQKTLTSPTHCATATRSYYSPISLSYGPTRCMGHQRDELSSLTLLEWRIHPPNSSSWHTTSPQSYCSGRLSQSPTKQHYPLPTRIAQTHSWHQIQTYHFLPRSQHLSHRALALQDPHPTSVEACKDLNPHLLPMSLQKSSTCASAPS